ncbi:MAG: UDP-glucose--hexose-1-phosphate uridylyltransferase [Clostridia bacterium]|nr:UDP-glucose--hexose-1-phosphate uridylyltransferase [Clostridia bacterium]
MINTAIAKLVKYGLSHSLFEQDDKIYITNQLLEALNLDSYTEPENVEDAELEDILNELLNYAVRVGIIEDSIVYRDLFDTKLMGILTPRPSEVRRKFFELYAKDPAAATSWYYKFSKDTDYIRRYRIKKDMKWTLDTDYGVMDITINLSKPEKDPKAIAEAAAGKSSNNVADYPKCQLCKENEGYAGRVNHPARQNHRLIPITVDNKPWTMQFSPYVYYNEHCIVFDSEHSPMSINPGTFRKLLSFVEQFPHYFVGSNADLPIVGGSILTHDHFQGGGYTFAMAKATVETDFVFEGFEDIKAGIVKWPMSVIRLSGKDTDRICKLADKILAAWRSYTDEAAFIYAFTGDTPHNTITPIARKNGENFELDLVLRNNITTDEHPAGVYHPHKEIHHIKRENIGLIEVMGLAVLPARLKTELNAVAEGLLKGEDLYKNELTALHADWAYEIADKYELTAENIDNIIKLEVGKAFATGLEHAGVYKRNEEGKAAFIRFMSSVK